MNKLNQETDSTELEVANSNISKKKSKQREIWERFDHETTLEYDYFMTFCELGPGRTLSKTAQMHNRSIRIIERYSGKHGWRTRAAAFDDYWSRRRLEEKEKAIREMERRQVKTAMAWQGLLVKPLEALNKKLLENPDALNKLDAKSLTRMVRDNADPFIAMANLERKSRGEDTTTGTSIQNNTVVIVKPACDKIPE